GWDWGVWEPEFRRFTRPRASTRGLRLRSTRVPIRGPARRGAGSGRLTVVNTTFAYLVNAIVVLLVVAQIREHRMDLRGLAGPVLAVGAAAVFFLRSVPAGGNDVLVELACVAAGGGVGWLGGLFSHLRRGWDGLVWGHAGWVSAGLWVTGVGARMAFVFAATHGLGPAIGRFSVAYHITSKQAWAAALVLMALADVLTRLAVLFVRSRRLAAPPAPRPVIAGAPRPGLAPPRAPPAAPP